MSSGGASPAPTGPEEEKKKRVGLWCPPESQMGSSGGGDMGDGGASYRASALRRCMEEADRSGRALEEVVAERWGTVEELTRGKSIQEALSAERAPVAFRRRRRRGEDQPVLLPLVKIEGGLSDKDILRQYEETLEATVIETKKGKDQPRKQQSADTGWTGLPTGSLGLGSTFQKGQSWRETHRRSDEERHPRGEAIPQQRSHEDPRPRKHPRGGDETVSNANVAAFLRANIGAGAAAATDSSNNS